MRAPLSPPALTLHPRCLFKPTAEAGHLDFVNAGSLSVNEMRKWLKDDEVYAGLLRMGFGTGKFRRTKWIFVWWCGQKMGVVKRAKSSSGESAMKEKMGSTSVGGEHYPPSSSLFSVSPQLLYTPKPRAHALGFATFYLVNTALVRRSVPRPQSMPMRSTRSPSTL